MRWPLISGVLLSLLSFAIGRVSASAETPSQPLDLASEPHSATAPTVASPARSDPESGPSPSSVSLPRSKRFLGWIGLGHESRPRNEVATNNRALVDSGPEADKVHPTQGPTAATADVPVRRTQAAPGDVQAPLGGGDISSLPGVALPANVSRPAGGQSISLEAALYGTLRSNPDLVTLRLGNATTPSPESVEVARHFPTTLNPTLWCDLRPITLIPPATFSSTGAHHSGGYYSFGQFYFYLSLRQPVEFGHQTTHRYHIAKAAYEQQRWIVVQAELLALVQTYRLFQTAAYRRERLKVAQDLANFNGQMLRTLEKRLEASQVPPADVVLARVEERATRQIMKAAQQDYVATLTDLRNQIGMPDSAGAIEPLGEFTLPPFIPPAQEDQFVQMALQCRPDIRAAEAAVAGTKAAENLARADRIPSPIVGPQYAMDEAGIQYIGLVYITPIPVLNSGKPLVMQRQAEHCRAHQALQQARQRVVAQVRSALAKWNGALELIKESVGLTSELQREVTKLEQLFDQGAADLGKLMQAQQRLIQLRTAEIDAIWAATQAQADLLLALGAPALIQGMVNRAEVGAGASPPTSPPPTSSSSPFEPGVTPKSGSPLAPNPVIQR